MPAIFHVRQLAATAVVHPFRLRLEPAQPSPVAPSLSGGLARGYGAAIAVQ